jgi:hypothetical protein
VLRLLSEDSSYEGRDPESRKIGYSRTTDDPEELPTPADVQALARLLGVVAADRWVYLDYVCWGGDIDFVYGLGSQDGVPFGPVKESDHDKVEAAYTGLMENFGVSTADALRFEPFMRGFWGED